MDARTAWENLSLALSDLTQPRGDYELKIATAAAAVELLFEFAPDEILSALHDSALPHRALVSWLVYEGRRLPGVDPEAVDALRDRYEANCPPGEGIIPAPTPGRGRSSAAGVRSGRA